MDRRRMARKQKPRKKQSQAGGSNGVGFAMLADSITAFDLVGRLASLFGTMLVFPVGH